MSNLIAILRPHWKCLQDMNDLDGSISLDEHLSRWDETHRRDVKFFESAHILTKTEQEKIKFYRFPTPEQRAVLEQEIEKVIESTNLSQALEKNYDSRRRGFAKLIESLSVQEVILNVINDVRSKNVS